MRDMDTQDEQPKLQDTDDPGSWVAAHVVDVQNSRDAAELRKREFADGDSVSESVVGEWAVYDNDELRFWPGLPTFVEREAAQRERDGVKPTTGHDLVVVEV